MIKNDGVKKNAFIPILKNSPFLRIVEYAFIVYVVK